MSNVSLITNSRNTIYIVTRYNNNYLDLGNVNKGKERNRRKEEKKRRRQIAPNRIKEENMAN